jgi:hypothetical protein
VTEPEFAAELRAFARRLRRHCAIDDAAARAEIAEVARAMMARADALAGKAERRMMLTSITVGRRTVMVQKPRPRFGL